MDLDASGHEHYSREPQSFFWGLRGVYRGAWKGNSTERVCAVRLLLMILAFRKE